MVDKFWKLGIVGWPLGYSLSPLMHNAALKAAGLQGEYKEYPVKPEELEDWLRTEGAKLDGFNVTMPHKEAVYEWMSKHPEQASLEVPEELRAVNTVKIEQGKLIGYNTDRQGFVGPLRERKGQDCLKGKRIFLLGAGGAAQAIALNVIVYGASSLTIWNRSIERARLLAEGLKSWGSRCNVTVRENPQGSLSDVDLIVNATSAGMKESDALLISSDSLEERHWVYDIVYQPKETKLIKAARQRRCQAVITGDEMLAHQGAEAFRIWVGKPAPDAGSEWHIEIVKVMQKVLDEHFAKHAS